MAKLLDLIEEVSLPLLEARPVKVMVVRRGQLTKKWKCPKGYKVEWPGKPGEGIPKCIRMTPSERRKLSRRAKLIARRYKSKRKLAARKAKRSRLKGKRTNIYARNKSKLAMLRR